MFDVNYSTLRNDLKKYCDTVNNDLKPFLSLERVGAMSC